MGWDVWGVGHLLAVGRDVAVMLAYAWRVQYTVTVCLGVGGMGGRQAG